MPLVRLQVRNEYGLGRPELYRENNREDPKAVLDGVTVAGLVGILRQLGDLVDFAAEVFHGLQEQVLATASRSHKLMLRAQNIESSLPPLEKAMLTQTSHIHFAYTAGCEWHCRTNTEQNHFIYDDLPQFIMDSYEECQDPPQLHLLDKFDTGGPGSCLRRYSDPTFFERVSAHSDEAYSEIIERARKTSRSKKKRLLQRNGEILQGEQMHGKNGRMEFTSHVNGQTSLQTASTIDVTVKSDLEDHSNSFDSRDDGTGYIECVFHRSNPVQLDEQEYRESSSFRLTQKTDSFQLASPVRDDNFSRDSFDKQIGSTTIGLTWDEKEEIMESKSQPCDWDETPEILAKKQNLCMHEDDYVTPANVDLNDSLYGEDSNLRPVSSRVQTDEKTDEIDSEPYNYLDALNSIESGFENDLDSETKQAEHFNSHVTCEIMENGDDKATSTAQEHDIYDIISQNAYGVSLNKETAWEFPDILQDIHPLVSEPHVTSLRSPVPSDVPVSIGRTNILADSHDFGSPIHEQVPHIYGNSVLDMSEGTNLLDNAHSLNDMESASIATFLSDVPVNIERTKNLADIHASENPISDQVHHICGNPVLDCSVGTSPLGDVHTLDDTGSASTETVPSDVCVNIGKSKNLVDSYVFKSPIHDQMPCERGNSALDSFVGNDPLGDAHCLNDIVSASIETVPSDVCDNIGRIKNLAEYHASESPICEQVPYMCGTSVLDCSISTNPLGDAHTLNDTVSASTETVPSDIPVNIGRTENFADSHASESPICEWVPLICGNSALDCFIGTDPWGDAHSINDTVSASIETVPSDVPANLKGTQSNSLEDSHASESLIHEQVSHTCGNSVLDCSLDTYPLDYAHTVNDTVSASIDTAPLDVPVNIGRTRNIAYSNASESSVHEQVPQICENSVLDCSVGTNPLGNVHTLNDTVSASIKTVPSDVPINLEGTKGKSLADSYASESLIHDRVPHIYGNSVLNCPVGTNSLSHACTLNETLSTSIEKHMSSGSESYGLRDKDADSINSNICKCKETPLESARDPSLGLWTNGGLLGLQPSKPPDFVMASSLKQESLTSMNVTDGVLNFNSKLQSNKYKEEQELSAEIDELDQKERSSRCLISHCDDEACIPGKTSDCHQQTSQFGQNNEEDLDEIRVLAPGRVLPVAHAGKTACNTELNKGSGENSPLLFGLGHKLLMNSFYRRVSFDQKSGPDNSLKTSLLEQSEQNTIVHQSLPETILREQVSYGYPIDSPPPSPPLEHMKISFHPINGFEAFKLKLKYPYGSSHDESIRDMFPSFHLVPEPSIPMHDSGFNSDDDDTFCRSSFVSDDCLSPHSDYNSDQWVSGDIPDSSDHEVDDSSHRLLLNESKLRSQEISGVTNVDINLNSGHDMYTPDAVEPSLCGSSLDFLSFDTTNPVQGKEYIKHFDYKNNLEVQSHAGPAPPAPPLPPRQLRVSNLQLDMMNEMQNITSEDTEQISDPNISESILQPRLGQGDQNQTDHENYGFYNDISCKLKDKLNQQCMNGQKRQDLVGIGKDVDEKEDFLHPIRTKSFNPEYTGTGKPNPTTNVKVTAILEKANAIRQVVARDDGEYDSWSDT